MESRRRTSTPKLKVKTSSRSKSKPKKAESPALRQSQRKCNIDSKANLNAQFKKNTKNQLTKKKIQDLKRPELIIKVAYKGKKITFPITKIQDKSLHEVVIPQIVRFEQQILKNEDFNPAQICNWKTTNHDVLKDYYFQTNKSIKILKDQLIQIQPIWRSNHKQGISLQDFEIIKCIGTGGFSRVFLARLKSNGTFYALKLMEKEGLFESGKQCVVINQRDILVELNSPHVVNLEYAFQTKHFIVLALQYCPGGQLFYYLRKIRKMTQDQARYCFIQILLGIQYLHNKHIVYRDIKPQNIMIDMNGNLKIADFGLSKYGLKQNQLATTYCGSPEYMAPQMLAKQGHGYAVDYYCMGALLYELVTGNPPFYSRDVDKIYYSIQNEEIVFPPHIELSPQIKMLLEGLLVKDPKRRLGSLGGIRQILGHPWVRKLKPADIINKNVPTPIHIDLLSFNINQEEIEEGQNNFIEKLKDQDMDFDECFEDFIFNRYSDMKILEEALPSVKSESTKENKSFKHHSKQRQHKESFKKMKGFKSSLSREKHNKYSIEIRDKENQVCSEAMRANKSSIVLSKKLKKVKSKKQLNLIERAKKRDDKSVGKYQEKMIKSKKTKQRKDTEKSPSGLKRIKSTEALFGLMKRQK